ncbi:MAG: hypothetical protein KDK62_00265 [Chlamydiia bacterium]|nr:hypothetical protein [Chlamydiia bacterium]
MLEKLPFDELDRFKEETKQSEAKLYEATKARVKNYRLIFISLGILFLILAWVIYNKSAIWFSTFAKPAVDFLAFALALAAFTLAAFLRYETETVRALYHHSAERLKAKYRIKKAALSQNHELPAQDLIRQRIALWGKFAHAKEKLKKLEMETLELMKQISRSDLELKEKEKLYNLALLEMKESFLPVLKEYEG